MNGIKIAIFDDNDALRDSISMLVKDTKDYTICGSYSNCNNIINNIIASKPDVVIMDIDMPGIDGIEAVKLIRRQFENIQILMFTVFDNDEKVFGAIKAGANGYILKSAAPQNLFNAISEANIGGAPMTPGIARKVLQHLQNQEAEAAKEDYHLSSREKEVLSLLVNGLSYKMIAGKLKISYDTVRAHMKKIYEKLHVTSMTEAVAKTINKRIL